MADIITHAFISAKTQSPDTTLVSKNEWNDGHTFIGGSNGERLVYDDTQPNNIRWVNPSFGSLTSSTVLASTVTPLVNLATYSFSLNKAALLLITYQATGYSSVGNATGTIYLVSDTLDISSFVITSPQQSPGSLSFPLNLAAGAHTLTIRLNTAGNVNVLTLGASISVFAVGV